MGRATWRYRGFVALLLVATATMPGHAIAGHEGEAPVVTARSFTPIPPGFAFDVQPRDDSDANLRLREVLLEELAARAYPVATGGPLRLRFNTDRIVPTTDGPMPYGAGDDRSIYDDDLRGGLPHDLFGARRGRSRFGIVTYRLRASVETRSGTVLWQGEATASASRSDERTLGRELATVLVAELGHTIDPKVLGGVGGP